MAQGDTRRQAGIQCAGELLDREGVFEAEVHDLAKRVHAGVGATGRGQHWRLARQVVDGLAQRRFDGRCVGLRLPAVVAGALVFEDEFYVHRSTSSTSTMGAPSPSRGPIFSTRV